MKLKTKMKKKIEKELLLMVRKLLLQVLIGWAKPLYTSLVARTHQHCTPPPPKFVPFFHYTIFWHVLSYRYYFKVFFSKVLKTDYWLLHCSVYFLEEEPTTPAPLRFATSLTLRPPLLLRTIWTGGRHSVD